MKNNTLRADSALSSRRETIVTDFMLFKVRQNEKVRGKNSDKKAVGHFNILDPNRRTD